MEPEELLNFASKQKELKILREKTPIPNLFLNDIKIKNKSEEDLIYLNKEEIFNKIRRGNGILEVHDPDSDSIRELHFARKGLIKFFDYELNPKKFSKQNDLIWSKLNSFFAMKSNQLMNKLRNKYLEEDSDEEAAMKRSKVYDANKTENSKGSGIYIYSTEKANGENIQISFSNQFRAWIVGSKNVSMLLRDEKDLNFYRCYKTKNEDKEIIFMKEKVENDYNSKTATEKIKRIGMKYDYVIRFAELWFEIMKRNIEAKNLLDEFKRELNGFTIIGEYIGDENHQHIKLYSEKDIHFYALIQNDSTCICAPLDKCKLFLNKYNLTMVHYQKSPLLRSKDELREFMRKLYIETLKKYVEEGGEGSVVYFSKLDNNEEEVVQLAKLKTFEYRFLRKLREKIRSLITNDCSLDDVIQKIKHECEEILRNEGDSLDLKYHLELARFVLKLVFTLGKNVNYDNNYASFINSMKKIFRIIFDNSKTNLSLNELLSDENFSSSINNILDILIDLRKEFYKDEEKERNSAKLCLENLICDEISYRSKTGYEKLNFDCLSSEFQKGKVYIFTNCGLIASGKTTLLMNLENILNESFKTEETNLKIISSDEIRAKMQDDIRRSQNINDEFAIDSIVKKKLGSEFNNQIITYIKSFYHKNKFNFIIADKNLFLDTLTKLKSDLERNLNEKNISYEIICFIPRCETCFYPYPLSLNYILQSYQRLKFRKNHETVDFDLIGKEKSCHLFFSFLSLFNKLNLFDFSDDKINFYALTLTDEKLYNFDLLEAKFSLGFRKMMNVLHDKKFNFGELERMNKDIFLIVDAMNRILNLISFENKNYLLLFELKNFISCKKGKEIEEKSMETK